MSRNRGSGSGPFLMEMVIAAGFFMLCVAVCVSAFVMADHLSRVGQDVNHGVLAAESLVERVKVGNTGDFGTYEPDEVFGTVFENWKTKDPEAKAVYQYIKDGGEVRNYQILWDKEWNSYPDTKELEKNGKKLAYVGLITTGVKDQMKEIAVVIFGYGTYGDQIYISLMNQYTPMPAMKDDPQLSRKVTDREYDRLLDHAIPFGVTNCFIQEGETAKESFIPEFDTSGV